MRNIIELVKQNADQRRQQMMRKVADQMGGTVQNQSVALPSGSYNREYNESAFISQSLSEAGIRPR
jgi:hypothetical protein